MEEGLKSKSLLLFCDSSEVRNMFGSPTKHVSQVIEKPYPPEGRAADELGKEPQSLAGLGQAPLEVFWNRLVISISFGSPFICPTISLSTLWTGTRRVY